MRWLLALWIGLGLACAEEPPGRPNLVLISLDTLRPDFLGCYGHPRPTSPTLDALAERGVLFEDVVSSAPWTLPAHATMLTGLYVSHHGVRTHETRVPHTRQTLAEELQAAGYHTAAVVNTENLGLEQLDFDQGFERFEWVEETARDPVTLEYSIPNTGDEVIEEALRTVDGLAADEAPFFLFVHVYDAHTDYDAPEYHDEFVSDYDGALDGDTNQLVLWRDRDVPRSEEDLEHLRELYEAEIRRTDDLVGELLEGLEQRGGLEDTVIDVTSDHGEEFGEHGGLLHGRTHYQELLAVPLLLAGPGLPEGERIQEPAGLVDVLPTVLGLAGLAPTDEVDGVDLSLHWRDPGALPERRIFFAEADQANIVDGVQVGNIKLMMRVGTEKLHVDRLTLETELYDVARDPFEQRDLAQGRGAKIGRWMRVLDRYLSEAPQPEAAGAELSGETRERLEVLGY